MISKYSRGPGHDRDARMPIEMLCEHLMFQCPIGNTFNLIDDVSGYFLYCHNVFSNLGIGQVFSSHDDRGKWSIVLEPRDEIATFVV